MAEQSHMSIINSSSRFVLEKIGLSREWCYLSQQQLTTVYFILQGCYQLGGNFISWKEEQFGRAATVLCGEVSVIAARGSVCRGWSRSCANEACTGCKWLPEYLVLPGAGTAAVGR